MDSDRDGITDNDTENGNGRDGSNHSQLRHFVVTDFSLKCVNVIFMVIPILASFSEKKKALSSHTEQNDIVASVEAAALNSGSVLLYNDTYWDLDFYCLVILCLLSWREDVP